MYGPTITFICYISVDTCRLHCLLTRQTPARQLTRPPAARLRAQFMTVGNNNNYLPQELINTFCLLCLTEIPT